MFDSLRCQDRRSTAKDSTKLELALKTLQVFTQSALCETPPAENLNSLVSDNPRCFNLLVLCQANFPSKVLRLLCISHRVHLVRDSINIRLHTVCISYPC